eukprot:COSAG01_NODE_11971_length_1824_cov_15.826667_2_plen_114_part_00
MNPDAMPAAHAPSHESEQCTLDRVQLDAPGEYWVDDRARLLYFFPPSDVPFSAAEPPVLSKNLTALDLRGASHVTVRVGAGGDNGSQTCRIVGESQSVLIMINPMISLRTRSI